jgi:hypothetical protein
MSMNKSRRGFMFRPLQRHGMRRPSRKGAYAATIVFLFIGFEETPDLPKPLEPAVWRSREWNAISA